MKITFTYLESRLIRKVPAAYSDGVYVMAGQKRPSPRKLSNYFLKGEDGLPSIANKTALFAFFGKLILHIYYSLNKEMINFMFYLMISITVNLAYNDLSFNKKLGLTYSFRIFG